MEKVFIPHNLIEKLNQMKKEATRIHLLLIEMFIYNESTKHEPLPAELAEQFTDYNPMLIKEDVAYLKTLASIVIDNQDDIDMIFDYITKSNPKITLEMHIENVLIHLNEIDMLLEIAKAPAYSNLPINTNFQMHEIVTHTPKLNYAKHTFPTHNAMLNNAYCADRESFVDINRKALKAEMSCLINVLREYEQVAYHIETIIKNNHLDVEGLKVKLLPLQHRIQAINTLIDKEEYYVATHLQTHMLNGFENIMLLQEREEVVKYAKQLASHFIRINALTIMESCMVITNLSYAFSNQMNTISYERTKHFCNAIASTVNMLGSYMTDALHDDFIYNMIYTVTMPICVMADIETQPMKFTEAVSDDAFLNNQYKLVTTNPFV